ncbi:MAG: helix-turn-helix domain-containing protein [Deferribacterales bacterium]
MSKDSRNQKLVELGDRMRNLIEESGSKKSDVARELGLTVSRLSNYLQGYREPDLETLSRFALHYNVSLDYFSLADCRSNTGDVRESIKRYAEYLSDINQRVSIEIITDLGRRRFSVRSSLVSNLIREHSQSRDSF